MLTGHHLWQIDYSTLAAKITGGTAKRSPGGVFTGVAAECECADRALITRPPVLAERLAVSTELPGVLMRGESSSLKDAELYAE